MIKEPGALMERFSRLRLHRDDIEAVVQAIDDAWGDGKAIVSVLDEPRGEYMTLEKLDELKGLPPQLHALRIRADGDTAGLDIYIGGDAWVSISKDDQQARGLFHRVVELLARREVTSDIRGASAVVVLLMSGAAVAGLIQGAVTAAKGGTLLTWPAVAGALFGTALWAVASLMTRRRRSEIRTAYKRDSPGFWERNRDDILVNAISASVGVVLGVAGTLIAQSMWGGD